MCSRASALPQVSEKMHIEAGAPTHDAWCLPQIQRTRIAATFAPSEVGDGQHLRRHALDDREELDELGLQLVAEEPVHLEAEPAAGIEHLFREEEAVLAIEVADRAGRLGQQMKIGERVTTAEAWTWRRPMGKGRVSIVAWNRGITGMKSA